MAKEALEIIELNIARYQRQLETETDEAKRNTLRSLLTEAHNQATLLRDERKLEAQGKGREGYLRDAKLWRARAEGYRIVAESSQSDATRSSYLNLARNYEGLAERAEARAASINKPTLTPG